MKILLADDKQEVRSALKLLLEHDKGIWTVEGEASNYEEVLERLSACCYDVILMDWELPGFLEGKRSDHSKESRVQMERLHSLHPGIKIVAMSGRSESRLEAQAAGVKVYVSKGDPPEALLDTLRYLNGAEAGR
jgi:DNA-binding NarL/FixJ family response regulator